MMARETRSSSRIEGNILTDPVPQIRSRQLSCTDSAIFGYGSIRSANYGYDGPIKYYSAADAPQESSAASSEDWESADLWWNPEEEQEVSRREKEKKAIHERSGHIKSSCGFRIDCVKKDNALMFG